MELHAFESPFSTAGENLDLEAALLERRKWAFFTHTDRPCVSVGLNQCLEAEVDVELARSLGVDVVRRRTGGGAVYRDEGCVAYSFVVPSDFRQDALSCVGSALASLGVGAHRNERNDFYIGDRKVSGFAFHELNGAAIVHGSILHSTDIGRMAALLDSGKPKYRGTAIASVRARVANVRDVCGIEDRQGFEGAFFEATCRELADKGVEVARRRPE